MYSFVVNVKKQNMAIGVSATPVYTTPNVNLA